MSNEWKPEKEEFYRVKFISNQDYLLCTSATKLENDIKERFKGKRLTEFYLPLDYWNCTGKRVNENGARKWICFEESGPIILFFEEEGIELCIHIEGYIHYRFVKHQDLNIEYVYDYPDSSAEDVEDIIDGFELTGINREKLLNDVQVDKTDLYEFIKDERMEIAANNYDLPEGIRLVLNNYFVITLGGSGIEWFCLEWEQFTKDTFETERRYKKNRTKYLRMDSEDLTITRILQNTIVHGIDREKQFDFMKEANEILESEATKEKILLDAIELAEKIKSNKSS